LTQDTLTTLGPFVSLMLGLVGFIIGLSAKKRLSSGTAAGVGGLSALGVMVCTTALFLFLLELILPTSDMPPLFFREVTLWRDWVFELSIARDTAVVALVIGAAASVSSIALLQAGSALSQAKGRVTELLRGASTTTQLMAITAFGLLLAVVRATDSANRFGIGVTEWAIAAAGSGVVCGLLFTLFIGHVQSDERVFLASVGAVILASGIGSALGISPLFVNLIAGVIVSGTSRHALKAERELQRLQHPLFVLLMIFAGAMWAPVSGIAWLCPIAYVVVRIVLKRVWAALAARSVLEETERIPRLGDGMLVHGTLAVAIAVSFAQRDTAYGPLVLTTVVLGTLATDIWAAQRLRRLLVDEGELSPTPSTHTLEGDAA
jgi:Kef-type K+ transport system membrane component KefB